MRVSVMWVVALSVAWLFEPRCEGDPERSVFYCTVSPVPSPQRNLLQNYFNSGTRVPNFRTATCQNYLFVVIGQDKFRISFSRYPIGQQLHLGWSTEHF